MHLYDAIEEYNFTHGNHFDAATGQYDLLMPHDLGRPLTHEEMDYNFLYQKQTMNGFRIFGSGANYKLNIDDIDKVLKFHKIATTDENYSTYTTAGYVADQYIWIPVEMAAAAQPAYVTLTANPTTINETNNSTVTYTLNVVNVEDGTTIDWSIATGSGITAADFVGGLTGTATINTNTASWTVEAIADHITEGNEDFTLTLATTDSAGNDTTTMSQDANGNGGVPLSATVTIADSSFTPQYNSITGANSIAEGNSMFFTVNTSYFFQAATINWEVDFTNSTATSADFTGATSGTINMDANGDGNFGITIANDLINDNENFTVKLVGSDSNGIPGQDRSKTVTITNAAFPTYTTFTGPATRLEGQNAQYALNGTNIPNGTQVGYTITGVDLSDISLNSLTGFITMNSNFGQLFFTCLEDNTVDGPDTMVVTLNNQDESGNATGLTPTLSVSTVISDVAPGYSITGPASIDEGNIGAYTFTASNMVAGTTVYWELRNYGSSANNVDFSADFVSARTGNGQVQTTSTPGEVELGIDIELATDMETEGAENFKLIVWDDAAQYATVAPYDAPATGALATKNITVNDLAPQWSITTTTNNQAEGPTGLLNFNILSQYVQVGQTFTWTAVPHGSNPAAGADFVGGSFPSGSGTNSAYNSTLSTAHFFTTELVADNTTEGVQQYKIELSDQNGNVVATKVINITDNSQTPAAQSYYFHLGAGGLPVAQNMITAPANQFYITGGAQPTSSPPFEEVWADMMANPSSYTGGANNMTPPQSIQLTSGTQFTIPAHGLANYYWLVIPSNAGVPDLTANAKLSLDGAPVDTCAEKIDFQYNGITHTLYRLNSGTLAPALLVEYI